MQKIKFVIFILSIIGLLVSSYLAYEYSLPTKVGCPIGGQSCEIVRTSIYSKFLGLSVPHLGILFYLSIAVLIILSLEIKKDFLIKTLFLLTLTGFIFSLYLTYLEAFIILAFCFWCVISAIISTLIFLLCTYQLKLSKK